jgi:FkbM family methyltransferase
MRLSKEEFIKGIQTFAKKMGFRIVSNGGWDSINQDWNEILELRQQVFLHQLDLKIIEHVLESDLFICLSQYLDSIEKSNSGFRQDLVALLINRFKLSGTFIEIGACDGLAISNTYLLELNFGWTGVLVEPDVVWHRDLFQNRNAGIETLAAWSHSNHEISFVRRYDAQTSHIKEAENFLVVEGVAEETKVKTISLNDLIDKHFSNSNIDFLSIDTEGSEYEILSSVDFSRIKFNFICVEHNYDSDKRERISKLLLGNGYQVILKDLTFVDDWYVPIETFG